MKNFIKYFTWTVFIGIILYLGFRIQIHLKEIAASTYRPIPLWIFLTLFPVFVGMLLRLPRLIQEIREKKHRTVNWAKLLGIGLPTFYIIITQLLLSTSFGQYIPFSSEIWGLMGSNISAIIGLVFGYVLLDSFKK